MVTPVLALVLVLVLALEQGPLLLPRSLPSKSLRETMTHSEAFDRGEVDSVAACSPLWRTQTASGATARISTSLWASLWASPTTKQLTQRPPLPPSWASRTSRQDLGAELALGREPC